MFLFLMAGMLYIGVVVLVWSVFTRDLHLDVRWIMGSFGAAITAVSLVGFGLEAWWAVRKPGR
jgi:hypothetical protein